MPVGKRFDFQLNGKGYMLVRGQGRSWHRTGLPDTPGKRSPEDAKYGVLPDEIDHPEVWNDWSGGAFHPYRRNGENTYHWAENFDARFPRQLVHAQAPNLIASADFTGVNVTASANTNAQGFIDVSLVGTAMDPGGAGSILVYGHGFAAHFSPTGSNNPLYQAFRMRPKWTIRDGIDDRAIQAGYPAAAFASYVFIGSRDTGSFNSYSFRVNDDGVSMLLHLNEADGYVVAGDRLWRFLGPRSTRAHTVRSVAAGADPTVTGNWSASINVGEGKHPIHCAIALEDQVFFGKPNGLFAGDTSGTFVNVLTVLEKQVHEDNCRDLTVHNNSIIVPHIGGVFEYQPGEYTANVREIGPAQGHRSPLKGRFRAVHSGGRWLYAGLYTGSQSHLLAADLSNREPVWHTLTRFPHTTKINRIHIDGITTASSGAKIPNRMWIATDGSIDTSGTAPVYWWPIPFQNDNPLEAPGPFSANYVGSARIDLGNVDAGAPGTPKAYRSVEVWADNLLSGYRYADIYYELNSSGSFALLGRANDSPKSTLFFPNTVNGQSIELSVRSFTASPAQTPVYRAFILRSATRPNSVDTITAQVRIADEIRDRMGGGMRSGATMLSELRDLAQQDAPVTLIDLVGAAHYVNVLPPVEEQEYYQKGEDFPEIMAQVKMSVMVYS